MSNMAVDVFARTLALASLGNGGGGSTVDTYTKAEIDKMFGEAGTVQVEAVDVLPTEDIKENVIYLVPNGSTGENYYNECMYINGKWEIIGTTEIDLSSYVTKEELEAALADKVTADVLIAYATKEYVDEEIFKAHQPIQLTQTYLEELGFTRFNFNKMPLGIYYVAESVTYEYSSTKYGSGNGGLHQGSIVQLFHNTGNDNETFTAMVYHWHYGWRYPYEVELWQDGHRAKLASTDNDEDINGYWNFREGLYTIAPTKDGHAANKKYVDDTVAAIEIPSIDGLATEEYADAAGQKAFDDMAAIAGNINDLTTETHETFTAAINEINDKVNNIEIPSIDLSKYATKQDVEGAIYEIDEDRDMKKYFVTDYGVYNIFTLDFIEDEETYYTIDSELGIAIQDIMNDFAANSGHESSCIIVINDIYRNAFKLYVNRPGMSLTTISPVEFLEDGYIHRIECADVNILNNEAKFRDVGYILKTSKTKPSADVDLTGYATETYVNNAIADATGKVNVFEGTQEEYDALSDEEKAKYTIVVIDDGEEV